LSSGFRAELWSHCAVRHPFPFPAGCADAGKVVGQLAPRLHREKRIPHRQPCDPVEPEAAEIVPHFAPGGQRPDPSPEFELQGADITPADVALLVGIDDPDEMPIPQRFAQGGQMRGTFRGLLPGKDKGRDAEIRQPLPRRQDGLDLAEQGRGSACQRRIGPVCDQSRTKAQGHDLVGRQRQRRQVDGFAQHVAHAPLPLHRQARGGERGHVAPDRAGRDFQLLGQRPGSVKPPVAQGLDDLEQAVGSTHEHRVPGRGRVVNPSATGWGRVAS